MELFTQVDPPAQGFCASHCIAGNFRSHASCLCSVVLCCYWFRHHRYHHDRHHEVFIFTSVSEGESPTNKGGEMTIKNSVRCWRHMLSNSNVHRGHLRSMRKWRLLTIFSETLSESVCNGAQMINEHSPFEKELVWYGK